MANKPTSAISLTAAAKKLGSKGGKVGGPARARHLSKGDRQRIARMGGKAKAARAKNK